MLSLWESTAHMPEFPKLKGDIKTDVLIIGGGIAGILCGYKLKNAGVDCVIAESDKICRGVTAGTTAKITVQHGAVFDKLINEFGTEKAGLYLKANEKALSEYKELCKKIDCDFKETDSYIYSLSDRRKIEKEVSALNKIGGNAEFCEKTELPFKVAGVVKVSGQAQFNPLKFLNFIAKDLTIYENTAVKELKGLTAVCEVGEIKAQKIIVATHFPIINKHGSYFLKMHQKRSYVSAFLGAKPLEGMYRDESEEGFSFRSAGKFLIIGGESKRTGKKSGGWEQISSFAEKYYPTATEKYTWAAQDCITLDGVPYIGNYSANTPDLYVATGFNKWGMTSSMAAAEMLTDMIRGKKNEFAEVFSPSRHILRKQLVLNATSAVGGLLYPTVKRCPHLGCALKWNKNERSWDCPCHGSRFSREGKLLNTPATGDIDLDVRRR